MCGIVGITSKINVDKMVLEIRKELQKENLL